MKRLTPSTSLATWRSRAAWVLLCFLFVMAQRGGQAVVSPRVDALSYFKSYFVTGDYVVGGVGLRGRGNANGIATGSIEMSGVPEGADVLAAFLYWQVVATATTGPLSATDGATFKGHPLRSALGVTAQPVGPEGGSASCVIPDLATGPFDERRTFTYRQDVLRYFDVGDNGKFIVNGPHLVQLPDSGSGGDELPVALGASLVVVYRDPNPGVPLSAVVLYDGGYTMDRIRPSMSQTISGFYQAAVGADGQIRDKITHIVGSGRANRPERLLFNNDVLAANPFRASAGASWDNVTAYPLSSAFDYDPASGQYVITSVDHHGTSTVDCLTWGAIVYRTDVVDTDDDGLLDVWEQSTGVLSDPSGDHLPNLAAMGADPNVKDVFVELGYMDTGSTAYGGITKPAHSHLPPVRALNAVGQAFEAQGVRIHFDAGNRYPTDPSPYIIPAGPLARGGESVSEAATVCAPQPGDPAWVCQFSAYPGTVGWKTGFRFLRDAWVSDTGAPLTDPVAIAACNASGLCRRRFDRNRQNIFRYAFSAHAIGLPQSRDSKHPLFHTPRTNTGIADLNGGDLMLTLGAFDDEQSRPVGSWFMQASTLMHELGHTFGRKHGGPVGQPNCKPNYLSVMNYLFQLRGLVDANGRPQIDYSRQELGVLDESGLPVVLDVLSGDAPIYRTAWYAPLASGASGPIATRFCNGSEWDPGSPPAPMVRVTGDAVGQVRWLSSQDINFDGVFNDGTDRRQPLLAGAHDWSNLRLNQVASRRNIGALYEVLTDPPCTSSVPCLGVGPLSLDVGQGDLGQGDLGQGDLGQGDLGQDGQGDLGQGDLGQGDLGQGDLGQGDLGQGDLGQGDLGVGSLGEPIGELDLTVANALNAPPVGVPDSYTYVNDRTPTRSFSVTAPGVLANDTDADDTSLVATLIEGSGPSHGTVTLNPNGSFTYVPAAGFIGEDSFEYTANDVSRSSNRTTVRIRVAEGTTFVGLLNIPPPAQKTFRAGRALALRWTYMNGSTVVRSAAVMHTISVRSTDGSDRVYTNTDPGSSSFRYGSNRWNFTLQMRDAKGLPFAPGDYTVTITSADPAFPSSPTFQIRLVP